MLPEEKARLSIDKRLIQSGWVIQDMDGLNLSAGLGVAVREFPTSTGKVDYALLLTGLLWVLQKQSAPSTGQTSQQRRAKPPVMPTANLSGSREAMLYGLPTK